MVSVPLGAAVFHSLRRGTQGNFRQAQSQHHVLSPHGYTVKQLSKKETHSLVQTCPEGAGRGREDTGFPALDSVGFAP